MQLPGPSNQIRNSELFSWLVWGIGGFFVFFQFLLQTSPSVMIPSLERAFQINELGVSLLSSSFFYTYLILQIPAGMLIDRLRPRRTLTLCLLFIALLTFVFSHAHFLFVAEVSRILMGVFCAPAVVATLYLAAHWFPAQRFALLAGMTEMMGMLGGIAGEAILAQGVNTVGWRTTISLCSIIALIAAFLTWVIVQDRDSPEDSTPHHSHALKDLFKIIKLPQAWINGLYCGFTFSIVAAFAGFWCVPYLTQIYTISLGEAADASSMIFLGAALGAPLLGWISDRLGVRRAPMILCAVISLILMMRILYFTVPSLSTMFLLLFFLGFFCGIYALPFAVVRDLTDPNIRGTAMGFVNMMAILVGSALLQPMIGWLLTREMSYGIHNLHAYQEALKLLPICLSLSVVLAFFVRETYCGNGSSLSSETG